MKLLLSTFYLCFVLLSFLSNGKALVQIQRLITVDANSHVGNFQTVQKAIDSIPSGNNVWTKIRIKKGTYTEKVNLPADKGFIVFEGAGALETTIQFGDNIPASPPSLSALPPSSSALPPSSSFLSPTAAPSSAPKVKLDGCCLDSQAETFSETTVFTISANNVVFKGISFVNSYKGTDARIAVAALVLGDKVSFYDCRFIGIQDTLSDFRGRHYFKNCYIEGAVDFIFGYGRSFYEGCTLSTVPSRASIGWVTAQGRKTEEDSSGFVFKSCTVKGQARTYLGRPWKDYSRVIFYQTNMSNVVVPQGWDTWGLLIDGHHTTYAEIDCGGPGGPGSTNSPRVSWEKNSSDPELKQFTSISFVDDGWISQQGT